MYGADSRAHCHPSELINEEQGPVFNVFNMGRRRGRHTDGTQPSLQLIKSPAFLPHFNQYSKMETHTCKEKVHGFSFVNPVLEQLSKEICVTFNNVIPVTENFAYTE